MKINFGMVDVSFENIDYDEGRLRRISQLMLQLLDEKLEGAKDAMGSSASRRSNIINNNNTTTKSGKAVTLDEIVVPPISIGLEQGDYEIASRCASAIYQTIVAKLR